MNHSRFFAVKPLASTVRCSLAGISLVAGVLFSQQVLAKNPDPYAMQNNTWISISGTVNEVQPDSFELDYGDGNITVEMDDGDRDADAYVLISGDKVTVNGMVDDDFYEATTIEASSVHIEKLGTTFFASSADEEDAELRRFGIVDTLVMPTGVTVHGTVTEVYENSFDINAGLRKMTVHVDNLTNNPLDDEGYQKIEEGDFVKVSGTFDGQFFTGKKLYATSLIELID